MEQCPCCGRYLKFNMTYFCGTPNIFYTCECGYDTRNQINTVTASPEYVTEEEK